jgi:lipopolysaccharide export system permease protein
MKIIDKYILRGFVGPLFWCFPLFIILRVVADIFSFIDDIVKYKISMMSLLSFYIFSIPSYIFEMSWIIILLSTMFLLINLNNHNELVAMKSSGISLWRILAPMLVVGAIVSCIIFAINNTIIPVSAKEANRIRRDELEKQKIKLSKPRIINNLAIIGTGNRIIFARSYDIGEKVITDIIIHEQDAESNLTSKITAKSGTWMGSGWKFNDVIITRIDNAGKFLQEPEFDKEKMMSIPETPGDFADMERSVDYMSFQNLMKYITYFKGASKTMVRSLLVTLHYKISYPMVNIIIILIAAPFVMVTTRGGALLGIGKSIAMGLLYYAFIAISLAYGKKGMLPPIVAAWLGNVVFAAWGIYLINKRT